MTQPRRRSRAQHPTVLFSLLLAAIFVACSTGKSAYPNVFRGSGIAIPGVGGDLITRALKTDPLNVDEASAAAPASTFERIWGSEAPAMRGSMEPPAQPVYFAWADAGEGTADAPFAVLSVNLDKGSGIWLGDPRVAQRNEAEALCLAKAIYFEARGEGPLGQLAVAQVILNRVKDPAFPKTICSVVFQNASDFNRCQFSFACDGVPDRVADRVAWRTAVAIAHRVVANGSSLLLADVGNATHYHATYASPIWAARMKRTDVIGHHIFYAAYSKG
jgi:hypothetical protein